MIFNGVIAFRTSCFSDLPFIVCRNPIIHRLMFSSQRRDYASQRAIWQFDRARAGDSRWADPWGTCECPCAATISPSTPHSPVCKSPDALNTACPWSARQDFSKVEHKAKSSPFLNHESCSCQRVGGEVVKLILLNDVKGGSDTGRRSDL